MIKTIVLSSFLLTLISCFSQTYEPTILIIQPGMVTVDKNMEREVQKMNKDLKKIQEPYPWEAMTRRENILLMSKKQREYRITKVEVPSFLPILAEGSFLNTFFNTYQKNDFLFYAVREQHRFSIDSLSQLANEHSVQYVLSFPKIHIYKDKEGCKMSVVYRLYDNSTKTILFESEITSNDQTQDDEYRSNEGPILSNIKNSIEQAIPVIARLIMENNPEFVRKRDLKKRQLEALNNIYYLKPPHEDIPLILLKDSISLMPKKEGYYQGMMNEDKTKLIAFFALQTADEDFDQSRGGEAETVSIFSDNDAVTPEIYANVIVGIKSDNKWYISRPESAYFNAKDLDSGRREYFSNLMKWDFFGKESDQYSPDFWEGYFFQKVPDLTKDPQWEKLKEYQQDVEILNRPYVGMYELIADQMKEESEERMKQFETAVLQEKFLPFIKMLQQNHPDEFSVSESFGSGYALIFPTDQSVVMIPVDVTDKKGDRSIRYFVYLPSTNAFFEWSYFEPKSREIQKNAYPGPFIIDQLATKTFYNFGMNTLDDMSFWNSYVLLKEGNQYKYLVPAN